jgi:hypothetical protein
MVENHEDFHYRVKDGYLGRIISHLLEASVMMQCVDGSTGDAGPTSYDVVPSKMSAMCISPKMEAGTTDDHMACLDMNVTLIQSVRVESTAAKGGQSLAAPQFGIALSRRWSAACIC